MQKTNLLLRYAKRTNMRLFIMIAGVALFLSSCMTNYELKDIYGKWMGEKIGFTFNEDGTCEIFMNGGKDPRQMEWNTVGNALEFVANGKVILSNVTVKGIKDDVLTIEMRPMFTQGDVSTVIHTMKRVE